MKNAIVLPTPQLTFFAQLQISLDDPIELGAGRTSLRRIIPIIGGNFKGPSIEGIILNLGADWQTIASTELSELDTRYALQTSDGAIIEVINKGFRHGPESIISKLAAGENVNPSIIFFWVNKLSFLLVLVSIDSVLL